MAVLFDDKNRSIVPRWRNFNTTVALGELRPLESPPSTFPKGAEAVAALVDTVGAWNEHHSFSFATDLISRALVLNCKAVAREAAEFILSREELGHSAAAALARRVLDLKPESVGDVPLRETVKSLRSSLGEQSENAFMWCDLGLAYAGLGSGEKARRAITTALQQAPTNRFIIRSAARLFLHLDDPETAHRILKRSPSTVYDPWLLSAEIAIATARSKTSQNTKRAQQILKRQEFPNFHLSELASAMGTLEVRSSVLRGRKLLRLSLESPTENAIAQAAWISRNLKIEINDERLCTLPPSPEASSYQWFQQSRWDDALIAAQSWWLDQQFSARPSELGSFLGLVKGDYKTSIEFATRGLIANPHEFNLLNNGAFAAANSGNLDSARKFLDRVEISALSDSNRMVFMATDGFIRMKKGDLVTGRAQYLEAINYFEQVNDLRKYAGAFLNYALAEKQINPGDAAFLRKQALAKFSNSEYPEIRALCARLAEPDRP